MLSMLDTATTQRDQFRHDALFYDGPDGFHTAVTAFVTEAIAADEPVLVVASGQKIARLREDVVDDRVELADMDEVGRNPARIIPAWRAFLDAHPGTAVRGVGEPISPSRDAEELVECQHHEALLNAAFSEAARFWLRCPYDTAALPAEVIAEARRSHPVVVDHVGDATTASGAYEGHHAIGMLRRPLPEPDAMPVEFTLRPGRLSDLRGFVRQRATTAGLSPARVGDLVLAANEVASNSLMYGGGDARVRMWRSGTVVCEVRDKGVMRDPLVGRRRPGLDEHDTRGMWIVNQLCDLVQIRSSSDGTIVRLHMRSDRPSPQ